MLLPALAVLAAAWVFDLFIADKLIAAAYRGQAGPLNALLRGRNIWPVEHYTSVFHGVFLAAQLAALALAAAMGLFLSGRQAQGTWLILAVGCGLRAAQFLSGRALWLDEAALAQDVLSRGWGELLAPLQRTAAPPGLLALAKAAAAVAGSSEYALRGLPLAAGVAALFVFERLCRKVLAPAARPLAVGLFAVAESLVYYSAEFKPYGVDAAVAAALWLAAASIEDGAGRGRRLAWLALAGAAAVWLSFPAVFILAGVGAALARRTAGEPVRAAVGLAAVAAAWLASFGLLYVLALKRAAADSNFFLYWAGAFAPLPRSWAGLAWYLKAGLDFMKNPGGQAFAPAAVALAAAGWFALRRRPGAATLAWGVFGAAAATLLASALGKYPLLESLRRARAGEALRASGLYSFPFSGRLLVFMVPAAVLLLAAGVHWVGAPPQSSGAAGSAPAPAARLAAGRWRLAAAWLLGAALLVPPLFFAMFHLVRPWNLEDIRPVLAEVRDRRAPGDAVYVLNQAAPAFAYYAPRYGFGAAEAVVGRPVESVTGTAEDAFTQDWPALRGRPRVWVVFSHVFVHRKASPQDRMRAFMDLLDAHGRRGWSYVGPTLDAGAYLYDFSSKGGPAGESRSGGRR